jgi:hypothetical protein
MDDRQLLGLSLPRGRTTMVRGDVDIVVCCANVCQGGTFEDLVQVEVPRPTGEARLDQATGTAMTTLDY